MPLDVERTVKQGVQLMHDYAVSIGMPEMEKDIFIYVDNFDNLVDLFYDLFRKSSNTSRETVRTETFSKGPKSFAVDEHVFINDSGIKPEQYWRGLKTAAHEFNHAQSSNLSDLNLVSPSPNQTPYAGPFWLAEGYAEFLAWRALSYGGVTSYEDRRYLFAHDLKTGDLKELSEIESRSGFRSQALNYAHSMFAVELLASLSGESSLMEYYASLRSGAAWQTVFKNTFGLSIGEFYDRFEEHEADGFPKLDIPKLVER